MGAAISRMAGDSKIADMKYLELKQFAISKGIKPEEANACPGKGRLFLALHNIGLTEEIASSILAKLKVTFDHVDDDKSGALEAEELVKIFSEFFRGAAQESVMRKVKEVIAAYDANGDGKLQFKEFVDMVHVGGFWDRFGYEVPIQVSEAVLALSKGLAIEAPAPPAEQEQECTEPEPEPEPERELESEHEPDTEPEPEQVQEDLDVSGPGGEQEPEESLAKEPEEQEAELEQVDAPPVPEPEPEPEHEQVLEECKKGPEQEPEIEERKEPEPLEEAVEPEPVEEAAEEPEPEPVEEAAEEAAAPAEEAE